MTTAIIGVGNIIFQDEGVGVYASKYLEKNYTFEDDVVIVDGGTLGFDLLGYLQDYERVIILDTVSLEDEAGSIYNIPAKELLNMGAYKQTAHEVEVLQMLEICSLHDKVADVNIIGIIPYDIKTVNISLSTEIKNKFEEFIDVIIDQLDKYEIKYKKNDDRVSLASIIKIYS